LFLPSFVAHCAMLQFYSKILSTLLLSRAQVVEKRPETVDDHSLMRWVHSINYSQ
jgi:hypothetical protein